MQRMSRTFPLSYTSRDSFAEKDICLCFIIETQSILYVEGMCFCFMKEKKINLCREGYISLHHYRNTEYHIQERLYVSASL